jgi:hypothetical protein
MRAAWCPFTSRMPAHISHRVSPPCRGFRSCIRVSPWVPLLGAALVGAGLPLWAIFTRRALETTRALSDTLIGSRTFAVDQLSSSVEWVTGLSVIIMACIVGLALVLSLLRTHHEAARLPSAKCGTWGHTPSQPRAWVPWPQIRETGLSMPRFGRTRSSLAVLPPAA